MLGGLTPIGWPISRQKRRSQRHTRPTMLSSIPPSLQSPAGCGCVTDDFIWNACINHFLVWIQSGKDAKVYASWMRELGKYHARGIHQWNGEKCSFHPSIVCSCGNCTDDDNLQCEGKPYESKFALSCELHSLGYEIECEVRDSSAENIIHSIMSRGHSNLYEAAFNVLPRYRAKSLAIHRLSYINHSFQLGTYHELQFWSFTIRLLVSVQVSAHTGWHERNLEGGHGSKVKGPWGKEDR